MKITFRQKEFNSAARKIIKNNKTVHSVINSPIESSAANILSKYNKAKASVLRGVEKTTGLPSLHGKVVKAENLSNPINAAKSIGRKSKKAKSVLTEVATNPGKATRKGTKATAENPIATIGTALGYAEVPLTGIYIPGTTAMSVGGEALAKRSKRYRKLTERAARLIDGKFGDYLEHGVNSVYRGVPISIG